MAETFAQRAIKLGVFFTSHFEPVIKVPSVDYEKPSSDTDGETGASIRQPGKWHGLSSYL
jgi:hypothetical protein